MERRMPPTSASVRDFAAPSATRYLLPVDWRSPALLHRTLVVAGVSRTEAALVSLCHSDVCASSFARTLSLNCYPIGVGGRPLEPRRDRVPWRGRDLWGLANSLHAKSDAMQMDRPPPLRL